MSIMARAVGLFLSNAAATSSGRWYGHRGASPLPPADQAGRPAPSIFRGLPMQVGHVCLGNLVHREVVHPNHSLN